MIGEAGGRLLEVEEGRIESFGTLHTVGERGQRGVRQER